MLPYLFIGLGIIIGLLILLVLVAASRPNEFRVARTVTMAADPQAVFPQVNDFRNWAAWSPYEKRDRNMKKTYEGTSGVGSRYTWNGNGQVGEGTTTIVTSQPYERIQIDLEFVRPFKCKNLAEFTFEPVRDGTAVTWSLSGKNTLMSKVMGLFINMDRMIGRDFEEGLASLKAISESTAKV